MTQLKTINGLAMMPLYDWPELHHLTDAAWDCIRRAARDEGLDLRLVWIIAHSACRRG